ncbi:Cytochrome c oxidase subunit 7A [Aspergillus fumigatus]
MAAAIPPITGMLRRGLVLDLSTAFGFGTTFGYLWWYGMYHRTILSRGNSPMLVLWIFFLTIDQATTFPASAPVTPTTPVSRRSVRLSRHRLDSPSLRINLQTQ